MHEDGEPGADMRSHRPHPHGVTVPLDAQDTGGGSWSRQECSNTPEQEKARRGEITALEEMDPRAKHTRSPRERGLGCWGWVCVDITPGVRVPHTQLA